MMLSRLYRPKFLRFSRKANDGKPADEAVHNTCFSCHGAVKARDFVFNRYAP
jgi:hypothetical protein